MSTLRAHLWREWREQRFAILAVGVVVPLLVLATSLVLSPSVVADPLFQLSGMAIAILALLITVGGDLLAGDARGLQIRWLERLPSGLATAFRGKLVFFGLSLLGATAYGYGCALLVSLVRGAGPGHLASELYYVPIAALCLASWAFACSAWSLRGGMGLVGACFTVALFATPAWLLYRGVYRPSSWELVTLAIVLVLGGYPCGWFAYVRGRRFGRGAGSSLLYGFVPVLALGSAAYGWSVFQLAQKERFGPGDEGFFVEDAVLADDGRTTLVVAGKSDFHWGRGRFRPYLLDLETGRWDAVALRPWGDRFFFDVDPVRGFDRIWLFGQEEDWPRFTKFDRGTGTLLPHVLPRNERFGLPFGIGQYFPPRNQEPALVRDRSRGRDFTLADVGLDAFDLRSDRLLVRPGRWMHRKQGGAWSLLDPETGRLDTASWGADYRPAVLLEDGRALLVSVQPGGGTRPPVFLDDASTRSPREVRLPETVSDLVLGSAYGSVYLSASVSSTVPAGCIPIVKTRDVVLRLNRAGSELVPVAADPAEPFLDCLDERRVLVIDLERRLVILDVETGARTIVFPPPPES